MKLILFITLITFYLKAHILEANDSKKMIIFLQKQRNLTEFEKSVLVYLKELNDFLNQENVDEYQKNKGLQWAHILMDEVKRVRMERMSVMWYLRQG